MTYIIQCGGSILIYSQNNDLFPMDPICDNGKIMNPHWLLLEIFNSLILSSHTWNFLKNCPSRIHKHWKSRITNNHTESFQSGLLITENHQESSQNHFIILVFKSPRITEICPGIISVWNHQESSQNHFIVVCIVFIIDSRWFCDHFPTWSKP